MSLRGKVDIDLQEQEGKLIHMHNNLSSYSGADHLRRLVLNSMAPCSTWGSVGKVL